MKSRNIDVAAVAAVPTVGGTHWQDAYVNIRSASGMTWYSRNALAAAMDTDPDKAADEADALAAVLGARASERAGGSGVVPFPSPDLGEPVAATCAVTNCPGWVTTEHPERVDLPPELRHRIEPCGICGGDDRRRAVLRAWEAFGALFASVAGDDADGALSDLETALNDALRAHVPGRSSLDTGRFAKLAVALATLRRDVSAVGAK
jgi:hypothetical protein